MEENMASLNGARKGKEAARKEELLNPWRRTWHPSMAHAKERKQHERKNR
jgi:hypothetical protein